MESVSACFFNCIFNLERKDLLGLPAIHSLRWHNACTDTIPERRPADKVRADDGKERDTVHLRSEVLLIFKIQ